MKNLFAKTHMPTVATVSYLCTSVHVQIASAGYSCCSDRSVSTGTAGWVNYAFLCTSLCPSVL